MEEPKQPKKSYYQRNKDKYKKGGKYYYYKSVEERRPKIPVSIVRGVFILSFDQYIMDKKVKYDTRTEKITYKGETRNIPKRYLGNLKGKDRQKQIKSILEEKKRPETKAKSRKSSHTAKFDKKYGEKLDTMKGKRSKKNIAEITGIPLKAVNAVYKKGEGAYFSSGSRPNQTPSSQAYARLASVIMGGKARQVDKDIWEKYKKI